MPELRKDYILDRYVIIATERGKRPHEVTAEQSSAGGHCFFCPGNEQDTPPEISRVEKDGKWSIRVFPNKFPAVANAGKQDIVTDNEFYTYADAVGRHEVVVETPDHEKVLSDLSVQEITDVLRVLVQRKQHLAQVPGVKYVSVFKNSGAVAGCSIAHTHCQIIAYNLLPPIIEQKEQAVQRHAGCPYCRIIQKETESDRRIYDDDAVAVFAPYASRFPYEAVVFPKRHVVDLEELDEAELLGFAKAIKHLLSKLQELACAYNLCFFYGIRDMHMHMELLPRFSKVRWAGFELTTSTIINPVTPEAAAEFYRNK